MVRELKRIFHLYDIWIVQNRRSKSTKWWWVFFWRERHRNTLKPRYGNMRSQNSVSGLTVSLSALLQDMATYWEDTILSNGLCIQEVERSKLFPYTCSLWILKKLFQSLVWAYVFLKLSHFTSKLVIELRWDSKQVLRIRRGLCWRQPNNFGAEKTISKKDSRKVSKVYLKPDIHIKN